MREIPLGTEVRLIEINQDGFSRLVGTILTVLILSIDLNRFLLWLKIDCNYL